MTLTPNELRDIEKMMFEKLQAEAEGISEIELLERYIQQMDNDNDTLQGTLLAEPSEYLHDYNRMIDRVKELKES